MPYFLAISNRVMFAFRQFTTPNRDILGGGFEGEGGGVLSRLFAVLAGTSLTANQCLHRIRQFETNRIPSLPPFSCE